MNILFRADSSSTIGTGHIMRDLVLAQQYKDSHIIFATQDLKGNINGKIDYKIVTLKSNALDELIEVVKEHEIDMVVIDHYEIDWEFEKQLKEKAGVKILSFDDTYERHCCDFLLNQNIHAKQESYNGLVNQGCYLMCGLEYALIRKEFKDARNRCESSEKGIKNILLTLGGADPDNTTLEILKHIEKMQICNIKITVVLGGSNPYINEIKSFVASSKMSIEIVIDAKNMAELMCSADIAISAAGSTTIELLYMRKPFFALAIADNQNIVYEALINKGLAWNVLEIDERLQKLLSNNLIFNRDIEIATKQVSKETI